MVHLLLFLVNNLIFILKFLYLIELMSALFRRLPHLGRLQVQGEDLLSVLVLVLLVLVFVYGVLMECHFSVLLQALNHVKLFGDPRFLS